MMNDEKENEENDDEDDEDNQDNEDEDDRDNEDIEDYNDDYTYVGTIDYSSAISYHHPLDPISDPANVIKVKSGSDIIFSWNANLESDVAG